MGEYDVAQICMNGHVITDMALRGPQHRKKFCDKCGEPTVMQCAECGAQIRGDYYVPSVIGGSRFDSPLYCHSCGKPYPWTTRRLENADELIDIADQLTDEERAALKRELPNLLVDGPRTQVATVRTRQLLAKVRNGQVLRCGQFSSVLSRTL